MKKNRLYLLAITIITSLTTFAQQVSVSDAMAKAKAFMQASTVRRAPSASAGTSTFNLAYTCQSTTDQKVCYYVFNRGVNNGFVIIGGDEVAQEVLAYSDNGTFDLTSIPDNFKWWLSQYQQQISSAMAYAETHPEAVAKAKAKAKAARRVAASSRVDIEPMVMTRWGQNEPYNSALPTLGTNYNPLVTGCVATAMAQIMKYHNYPTSGVGSNSYEKTWSTGTGTITKTFTADFGNTTYEWTNMTDTYGSSSTEEEKKAVAKLLYHCGVAVNMNYGQSASSAYNTAPAPALTKTFKYNKAIRYLMRNYYADDAWENMIYNELAQQRPVLYDGKTTSNAGHAFVCDGYNASDDTYHMNWGWNGYYNCYVKLTGTDAIKPGGTGTGGGSAQDSYDQGQGAVISIIPEQGGIEVPVVYNYTNNILLKDNSSTISSFPYVHNHGTQKILTLTENVWNQSISLSSFDIGVKATDTTTGYEYYFSTSIPVDLKVNGYTDRSVTFDVNEIPRNGTYKISMVARNPQTSNDWYDVGISPSVSMPTVTITGASAQAKEAVEFGISGTSVQASRTLQISHSTSYKGNVTYTSSNTAVATVNSNGVITGKAVGNATITAIAEGNTYFNRTEKQFSIEVTPFVKDNATATVEKNLMNIGQTMSIAISEGYDGTPTYTTSDADVATVEDGVITGIGVGTAVITVTIPETDKFNGATVKITVTVTKGMMLSKTPYFEQANPWAENMILHLPLYNGTNTTFNDYVAVVVQFSDAILTYRAGLYLSSGKNQDYTIDLSPYKSHFEEGKGKQFTIQFYADKECTKPFNYPSITYVYQNYLAGDISGDGKLSIDDVAGIKDEIIRQGASAVGTAAGPNTTTADFNSDGMVDIIDVAKLINFLTNK